MIELAPVAFVSCKAFKHFDAPRQGVFGGHPAEIRFLPGRNFEAALEDLKGVDRIWLIFLFDGTASDKPKVRPPGIRKRIGVFATRSPHRPNPIGMSCVKLEEVRGLTLSVSQCDLLDGTAILDVKPYVPEADSFPEARCRWREQTAWDVLPLGLSAAFMDKAEYLAERSCWNPIRFALVQLACDPMDDHRKRIRREPDGSFSIGFRTWRILFHMEETGKITVTDLVSNYSAEELLPGTEDRYGDKDLHRALLRLFPVTTET